jgi:hypothetical protein
MADPFTKASPIYQAAIRHPHKTGVAMEIVSQGIRFGPGFLVFLVAAGLCLAGWIVSGVNA